MRRRSGPPSICSEPALNSTLPSGLCTSGSPITPAASPDERWRAVEIGSDGWRVVAEPPVRFRFLGALLDATSQGLRALPDVRLDRLRRMADLARATRPRYGRRVCPAYRGNRRTAIEDAIEADPVAACVRGLMAERGAWGGERRPTCWAAIAAVTEVRPTAPVGPRTRAR